MSKAERKIQISPSISWRLAGLACSGTVLVRIAGWYGGELGWMGMGRLALLGSLGLLDRMDRRKGQVAKEKEVDQ